MKQIVLDFETYYDADYSLRKMTPVQYILDPRFEMIGCAVKEGDGKSFWLTHDGLKRYLAGLPPRVVVVSHNALFDMCILAWRYDYTPTLMIDTLGMARAWVGHKMRSLALASLATYLGLGTKGGTVHKVVGMRLADIKAAGFYDEYAAYSCNDADLCWDIYRLFVSQGFPASEIAVMDTVLRCATEPKFVLDQTALAEHLHNTLMEKERLLSTIGVDNRDDLMSNDRFAECLRALGVEPPTKISLTTGKETYAFAKTDQDFMDLEEHENPQVQMLVAARLGVKSTIEETRTQRLIEISHLTWSGNHSGQSGLLPMALRYSGAHTHRLCLAGDTVIAVLRGGCILTIPLTDLLPQDYVWDGEEFVQHGGVSYAGIKAVITYDGITGTTDHRVLTALAGYCPLRVARDLGISIVRGAAPDANRINTTARPVRPPTTTDKDADGESVPGFRGVYDIIDCGPRNRFMANGRIVHNSGEWKLNMQNLPARGNSKIREAIRAPLGHKVVAVDASQIEARMAAWFCGAWDMVNAFAAKEDVYSSFASAVFGYEVLKKSHPVERFIGKTGVLGLQYNLGWPRFQKSVAMSSKAQVGEEVVLSDEEAAKVVATYRSTYHQIPAMWRRLQSMIPRMTGNLNETIGPVTFVNGGVKLPSGLFLRYHGLENKEGQWWFTYGGKPKYIYGGKMLENIIQALARICVMDAAVRVRKRLEALGLGAIQLNLQVHDELVYIVPDGHVDQVTAIVMEEMIRRPSWGPDIPLDAEAGCGRSYGAAK